MCLLIDIESDAFPRSSVGNYTKKRENKRRCRWKTLSEEFAFPFTRNMIPEDPSITGVEKYTANESKI